MFPRNFFHSFNPQNDRTRAPGNVISERNSPVPPIQFGAEIHGKTKTMQKRNVGSIAAMNIVATVMFLTAWHANAQNAKATYGSMASTDQYLMEDRGSEIAMAKSAVPESLSRDAEVFVLGRKGYETAIKGKNGFVCIVARSWTAPIDDPDF